MGLTLAKCPACGANLNLETDTDYFYCPHCGSKVLQQEDRIVIEHVIRTVDEAKVKRAELKQAKIEAAVEKERIQADRVKEGMPVFLGLTFVLALAFLSIAKAPPIVMLVAVLFGGLIAYKYVKQNKTSGRQDKEPDK